MGEVNQGLGVDKLIYMMYSMMRCDDGHINCQHNLNPSCNFPIDSLQNLSYSFYHNF